MTLLACQDSHGVPSIHAVEQGGRGILDPPKPPFPIPKNCLYVALKFKPHRENSTTIKMNESDLRFESLRILSLKLVQRACRRRCLVSIYGGLILIRMKISDVLVNIRSWGKRSIRKHFRHPSNCRSFHQHTQRTCLHGWLARNAC